MFNKASEQSKNVVLIGAGNLATHLGKNLLKQGYLISQVYSRTLHSATTLANLLEAKPITHLEKLIPDADFYFFCLKDDSIEEMIKKSPPLNGIVVHPSGSISLNVLSTTFKNCGVLYPVQTFNKHIPEISFRNIPICLEGSNEYSLNALRQLAMELSNDIREVNSDQRKSIHLAAVFACNFVNYLFTIASSLLKKENLDFSILQALINETVTKALENPPDTVQTGPAIRNDIGIIQQHIKLLESDKDYQEIYTLLTKNIINSHQK